MPLATDAPRRFRFGSLLGLGFGSSLNEVVKCTVMIEDINQWGEVNEVYTTYFPDHFPARSALGADGLALGALLEIECWATVQ